MSVIPGGRTGLAERIAGQIDQKAGRVAVWFCHICVFLGFLFLVGDFLASLFGWGVFLADEVKTDFTYFQFLGWAVSLAPQAIQTTFNCLAVADVRIVGKKPLLWLIYVICFLGDNYLDFKFMTSGGTSPIVAAGMTIFVFSTLSEIMIGIFLPLDMAISEAVKGSRGSAAGGGRPVRRPAAPVSGG